MLSILKCCTNRIHIALVSRIQCRNLMKSSDKMEILLKQADLVPRSYELIYRETSTRFPAIMYHAVNLFTLSTSAFVGYLWYYDLPVKENSTHFDIVQTKFEKVIVGIAMTSALLIAGLGRKIYPIRIYYNNQTKMYRALFIGKVPFSTEFYDFPAQTAKYVSKDSVLPWRKNLINCNGRKILFEEDNFKSHNYFLEMLKPEENC